MPAVAITDHGNMFAAIEFYRQAMETGIKPIIGCEIYIAPKSRFEKSSHGIQDASFHFTVLVKNEEGYKNLIKLVTQGYTEGFYYKPRVDKTVMAQYANGLIGLSGCLKSETAHLLNTDQFNAALSVLDEFKHIFPKGDFYIEIQDHNLNEQTKINTMLVKCARDLGIPLLATNDVHYLNKEDAFAHEVLLGIQTQTTLDDPNRMRLGSPEFYFKSPEEMQAKFNGLEEAINNTIGITEKSNLELDFDQIHLPHFDPPDGKTKVDYLKELCMQGLNLRYPHPSQGIIDRLNYEIKVIKDSGFAGYFLIVWDFVRQAKNQEIPVGPGRGSAAGSLVSYLLGITDIDPLKYGLLFERFLNPERVSLPDMDIDFCFERRQNVIDYVVNKYGKDNVAQIITFGTMMARAVVRDVGRVMNIAYSEIDKIAKLIPPDPNMTLEHALKVENQLTNLYKNDPQINKLINISLVLEGLTRHASTHAAGVVISPKPLTEYIPLFKMANSQITTGYAMESLEKIGLLKIDFLGLRTLTVIHETLKIIRRSRNISVDIRDIPMDNPETFKLLQKGETIGIFQLESSGMRDILRKMRPERFEDIIALLALYRPGPIGSGMVEDFIKRKREEIRVVYDHKKLEPILKETYGIILYQEQVMRIASEIAGFSMSQADMLRRSMSKKIPEVMDKARKSFIEGALRNGINFDTASKIFNHIEYFAGYGFNKSHSAAYAMISYQTAYLKANYLPEFMTALLTSEKDNTDKIVQYINECNRLGIKVLPPDINESFDNFSLVSGDTIRFGLSAVKNVGQVAVEEIVKARNKKNSFKELYDFCESVDLRIVNRKVIESLIKCGAFDSFSLKRSQLMAILDDAIDMANSLQRDTASGQATFFDNIHEPIFKGRFKPTPQIKEWPESQLLTFEKEMLGFYITGHPLAKYEEILRIYSSSKTNDLTNLKDGQEIFIGGMIANIKKMTTRRQNERMAIIILEDLHGEAEAIVFPDTFKKFEQHIYLNHCVFLHGKLSLREEDPRIVVAELFPIEEVRSKFTKSIVVRVGPAVLEDDIKEMKEIFLTSPGKTPVTLEVKNSESDRIKLTLDKEFCVEPNEQLIERLENIVGKERIILIPKFNGQK
jgi:DNA polymerase-3 subunit alpha